MPDDPTTASNQADVTAATADKSAKALSYALRYDERGKPRRRGGDLMAGIAAERLTEHLRRSGFIIMKARQVTELPTKTAGAGGRSRATRRRSAA